MAERMEEQLVLRVSAEMKRWLEEDAAHYGRTVAQSVRFYLEEEQRAQKDEEEFETEEAIMTLRRAEGSSEWRRAVSEFDGQETKLDEEDRMHSECRPSWDGKLATYFLKEADGSKTEMCRTCEREVGAHESPNVDS